MNRKGQALVEFVLILPVMILILFTIYDFGNLLVSKNKLENTCTDVARLVRNGENIEKIRLDYPEVFINIIGVDNNYKKVEVGDDVKIITPFLNKVLGNPCKIKTERIISDKNDDDGI